MNRAKLERELIRRAGILCRRLRHKHGSNGMSPHYSVELQALCKIANMALATALVLHDDKYKRRK